MRGIVLLLFACAKAEGSASHSDSGSESRDGIVADEFAAHLEVGSGYEQFTPITEGADLALVAGPQGGYHIFTSVRLHGFEMQSLNASVTIQLAKSGDYVGPAATASVLEPNADDWYEQVGLFNFVNDPIQVRDQEVIVRAYARDIEGTEAVDEKRAVVR